MTLLEGSHIAERIHAIMSRSGLKKAEHAKHLAALCGIHISQVYKKLKGEVDFTLEQIRKIELHYGIQILQATGDFHGEPGAKSQTEALFTAGPLKLPCYLEVGELCTSAATGQRFCAYVENSVWHVSPTNYCPPAVPLYEVGRLQLETGFNPLEKVHHIAILEDQRALADTWRDYLTHAGYTANAYYDLPSFLDAVTKVRFDAFLLDWFVGDRTSEQAMVQIRRWQGVNAPIILITGGLEDGKADENQIVDIVSQYKISEIYEKPVRLQIVTAMLKARLA